MALGFQTLLNPGDASGVFRIQFAAGAQRAPIRHDAGAAGAGSFGGCIRRDPRKNPCGNRATDGHVVLGREKRANLIDRNQLSFGRLRMISSTSVGDGITIVPAPQRLLILPSILPTFGKPLLSANFSFHDFFEGIEELFAG